MSVWQHVVGDVPVPVRDRSVVTIGNFDGVHRGHQEVLRRARAEADALAGSGPVPLVAVTFEPHPLVVLAPDRAPLRLTTAEERARLLQEAGADVVAALAFGSEMASWDPAEFVDRVLVAELRARRVVVGESFRFGRRAAGDVEVLRDLGEDRGMDVVAVPVDGDGQPWSSTRARALLAEGDVEGASVVLGRAPSVRGVVVRGDQRGRELGYPTANLPVDPGLAVPADGVYAGRLRAVDEEAPGQPAAVSVGTNPTFDGVERRVEAYVLDRTDLDLYGVEVEISTTARIRGQVRFDGIDALVSQMADDVERCRTLLR